MSILFCNFDGTSRIPGVRFGAEVIYDQLIRSKSESSGISIRHLQMENQNSAIYCKLLKETALKHPVRLAVGGEHLITLPLVEVLKEHNPDLRLVVLDAHHDAYFYPLSTHYSVFYHLMNELNVPVLYLGLRYEIDKAFKQLRFINSEELTQNNLFKALKIIDEFIAEKPFYISLDLDVIDPTEFGAVSSPVPKGLSIANTVNLLASLLKLKPIACDLVEYNPLKDTRDYNGLKSVIPLINILHQWSSNVLP